MLTTVALVLSAASLCKFFSKHAAGSGLPEFKSLIAGEMSNNEMDKLVSKRILGAKILGLVMGIGSSLSIGSEGPLVHTAACIAYLLMKFIPEFGEIFDSSSLTKQIFAASAAVGVASAFNAPVGGLLFSVEVTSSFYLISNYWRSFIAATAGSIACNLFLVAQDTKGVRADPLTVLKILEVPLPYLKWELMIFMIIGVVFGYAAHYYLQCHQKVHVFMRPYNKDYPLVAATIAACITAITVYVIGAYTDTSVGVIALVSDSLTTGKYIEMQAHHTGVKKAGGLIVHGIFRVLLTLMGTNIAVPAGIFMVQLLLLLLSLP